MSRTGEKNMTIGGVDVSQEIDRLIWRFRSCRSYDECAKAFRAICDHLSDRWVYLIGWSSFEAWGAYYISPDRKLCVYVGMNPRPDPPIRWVETIEFKDPSELANRIWRDQKGCIPFRRIAEEIKRVFGVDVKISEENAWLRMLFGEAADP